MKPIAFVSCGQSTDAEKQLGSDICALIRELRPDVEPYFADNQSSVEGLSNHILKALYKAACFICVMHNRGTIYKPDTGTVTRGSVWIEQEIAIAAFMLHVLDRNVPIFFYKQAEVGLEGIRSVLLMNPRVQFTQHSQILEDLTLVLPSAQLNPFSEYDVVPEISHKLKTGEAGHHTYTFFAGIKNVGKQRITDFLLHVYFPRAFLNPRVTWGSEDHSYSTESHICFAVDQHRQQGGLYPGHSLRNPLAIEYFVNDELFLNPKAMQSKITVDLFSGSISKRKELDIKDYHGF